MTEQEFVDALTADGNGKLLGFIAIPSYEKLPERIRKSFADVIGSVLLEMRTDKLPLQKTAIDCVFSEEELLNIVKMPPEATACACRIAYYPLDRLQNCQDTYLLEAVIAEELCHLIWDISDETIVKFKVLLIVRRIYPTLKFADLYYQQDTALLQQQYSQIRKEHSFSFRLPELSEVDL